MTNRRNFHSRNFRLSQPFFGYLNLSELYIKFLNFQHSLFIIITKNVSLRHSKLIIILKMRLSVFVCYKKFLLSLKCLLFIHLAALVILTIFRFTFFFSSGYHFPPETEQNFLSVLPGFIRGLWFDNVIACYILLLPLTAVSLSALLNYYGKALWRSTNIFFFLFYGIVFLITAANIPYFRYFFKIINSSVYNWFGYMQTTAGMVVGETSYYPPFFGFLIALLIFIFFVKYLTRHYRLKLATPVRPHIYERLLIFLTALFCIGLCLFGIRGRMGYNPIKVSAAYYCTDPFLNQLGISPVFNLLSSTLDDARKENRYLHLMPEEEALNNVKHYLNRQGIPGISPIARSIESTDTILQSNIVLVFMESMSAHLMQRFGQSKTLTPFLDSLYYQSLSFPNFYSSGIHTNHGMYSTLYSYPSVMKRNAMKGSVIPIYSGLPTVLKDQSYQTLFFMTHESQYDNMNAFFRTNGFDEIFSQENYPKEKVVNGFGVQDDFLYNYAIDRLNERATPDRPFFAVLLSISNHPPYIIPPYFHPHSADKEDQIVEYADWSIRQLMTKASQQNWFKNTIFVFLGDHGKMVGNADCEMPQSYNHIPLMIYAPERIQPQEIAGFGGQIDVAPTLLGLLNIPYTQNNFGIDLIKESRPCMFFTADNMIGAKNDNNFYIYIPESKQEFCYALKEGKITHTEESPEECNVLKTYAFSMLQTTEYLVKQQLTIDKNISTKP